MASISKTPREVVKHTFDFTAFEADGGITGYAIGASQVGLTLVSSSLVAGVLTVVLAGGSPDWAFVVGARAIRGDLVTEQRLDVRVTGPALEDLTTGVPSSPDVPTGSLFLGPDLLFFGADGVLLT